MSMKRNSKILLINGMWVSSSVIAEYIRYGASENKFYLTFPIAVMTLAAWLKYEFPAIDLSVVDLVAEFHKMINDASSPRLTSYEDFVGAQLDRFSGEFDIIGISMNASNAHRPNMILAELCKKKWPNAILVVGGAHATSYSEQIISSKYVDILIRGAAERSFLELVRCLMRGEACAEIDGVVLGLSGGSISQPFRDLNEFPGYRYDLIDMEYYVTHDELSPLSSKGDRVGVVMTSRGCPYQCTYCAASQVHGKRVVFRSVDSVINEIAGLIDKYQINRIAFIDDLFGSNKAWFYDFWAEVDRLGLKFDVVVPAGLSLNVFNKKMLDVLILHGLKSVFFPVESGSSYVQRMIIRKNVNLAKAKGLIAYAKSRGVFVGVNIVMGFPGETVECMEETREYVRGLEVDWCAFFIAYPYPGTAMTSQYLERGDLSLEGLEYIWDNYSQGSKGRGFDTVEITSMDLVDYVYDLNIFVNFFENHNYSIGSSSFLIERFSKVVSSYPYHVVGWLCLAKCWYELCDYGRVRAILEGVAALVKSDNQSSSMLSRYRADINVFLGRDFFCDMSVDEY